MPYNDAQMIAKIEKRIQTDVQQCPNPFNSSQSVQKIKEKLSKEYQSKAGLYFFFEKNGEKYTLVRIGSSKNLYDRLCQHFIFTKDESIFRKNVGECIIKRDEIIIEPNDWNEKTHPTSNFAVLEEIEKKISKYIGTLYYSVLPRDNDYKTAEKELICFFSKYRKENFPNGFYKEYPKWLGKFSSKEKIKKSLLWQTENVFSKNYVPNNNLLISLSN